MVQFGKYSGEKFVAYLRENPHLMDRILKLYNNFDLPGLRALLEGIDFAQPFPAAPLTHQRYIENKEAIEKILRDPSSYAFALESKGYLDDNYIKKLYSNSAGFYDDIWGGTWIYETRKETLEMLNPQPGERILEVGVGTGVNLDYFPPGCEVTGIDFCEEMLQQAGERAKKQPGKKITLELMYASSMTFPDNSFDGVLSFYFLCNVADPGRALQEIRRVCKPDGKMAMFEVIKSEIPEVALVQYLYRPIAREMGPIYLEFCPPYMLSYDALFDLPDLLQKASIEVEERKFTDPFQTIVILRCRNKK
jgi:phosphatidylethanolamine/phosphatidyl-N-methylethanolamine N-methyltransferase